MKGLWRANPDGPLFPPWDIFPEFGITRFYVPLRRFNFTTGKYEPNGVEITKSYRNDIQSHGIEYAQYSDPSWTSLIDPSQYIGEVLKAQMDCDAISTMLDIEYHDSDFVLECIRLYRSVKKFGPLSWTLEPFQAGWFKKSLVDAINKDVNMVVVVQNFFNNMNPAGTRNGLTPRQELLTTGIASNRVKVFYDGQLPLPLNWDGCILSEERLP